MNQEPKFLELFNNISFIEKSIEISNQMKNEDFKDELIKTIIEQLATTKCIVHSGLVVNYRQCSTYWAPPNLPI